MKQNIRLPSSTTLKHPQFKLLDMFRTSIASASSSARHFSSSAARNSFARVQILGRIGQDITEAESAQGNKYIRYPVAVQTKKDGPVSWFNVLSFNEQQNNFLVQYVRKGALVHIDANVRQEVYEKEDGSKSSTYSFIQNKVDLLQNPKVDEEV